MGETRSQGKWSWDGMVATFTFASGEAVSFDTSMYPGIMRQFLQKYGDQQKLADGAGGKDLTVAEKIAKMLKTHNLLCAGHWRNPDVIGKGGVKKADFDAEKARANTEKSRADAAMEKIAAMEVMIAEMAATIKKLSKNRK